MVLCVWRAPLVLTIKEGAVCGRHDHYWVGHCGDNTSNLHVMSLGDLDAIES